MAAVPSAAQPACATCGAPALQACHSCARFYYCQVSCAMSDWDNHAAKCAYALARSAEPRASRERIFTTVSHREWEALRRLQPHFRTRGWKNAITILRQIEKEERDRSKTYIGVLRSLQLLELGLRAEPGKAFLECRYNSPGELSPLEEAILYDPCSLPVVCLLLKYRVITPYNLFLNVILYRRSQGLYQHYEQTLVKMTEDSDDEDDQDAGEQIGGPTCCIRHNLERGEEQCYALFAAASVEDCARFRVRHCRSKIVETAPVRDDHELFSRLDRDARMTEHHEKCSGSFMVVQWHPWAYEGPEFCEPLALVRHPIDKKLL